MWYKIHNHNTRSADFTSYTIPILFPIVSVNLAERRLTIQFAVLRAQETGLNIVDQNVNTL